MIELPTTFGKYYLTEKLATGGMAEIYLAKIIGPGGFEKPLVIKQIHPRLSGQRHFVDLFVAEAKTLVALTHGNIVPVYELGVVDETYFIAMDYIDGPTLYRLTETMARRETVMEPALAAWITGRVLEGLDYAHRKGEGVIHRDLSPRNVMLSRDGEVKLVDFGIAVTLGDPGEGETRQSAPTGSFPYMSPEQVRREQLTVQTDLFSTGVLLWEMLTGRRLFQRPEADATLAAVLNEPITVPSRVRAEVPAKLDEVVMRALERDLDTRWSSAAEMLAALNKFLYSLDETPGARDVASLVARYCPPETRRLPTHLEAVAHDVLSPEPLASERPVASGPATAVIPRDATGPKGKPQRHKSFATNVDLAPIFEGTGPLPAFHDDDEAPEAPTKRDRPQSPTGEEAEDPAREARDTVLDVAPVEDSAPVEAPPARRSHPRLSAVEEPITAGTSSADSRGEARTGRELSGHRWLVLVGLGGVVLAALAIGMFVRGRERVLFGDDAGAPLAARDATTLATTHDAATAVPATLDAGVPPPSDARGPSRDAGSRRPDAARGPATRRDPVTLRPDAGARATATLKIGADPWGEIYVDGKLRGRTPRELVVPAGRHTIEIVFPAETPPRKQTFAVDLAAGEIKPIQADFRP